MSDIALNTKALGIGTSPAHGEGNIKSLQGRGSSPKALASDPALANWYEQAYAYYQSVASGQQAQPEAAEWNEFLTQMNWAYEQLRGSSWTGSDWGEDIQPWEPEGDFGSSQGGSYGDPFGGEPGTNGNLVHTGESSDIGFTGDVVRDVWSNDVNLNIDRLSVDVQAVIVKDESVNPAVDVLKLVLTDKATGKKDIIRIHDFQDADINVFSSTQGQVQDDTGLLNWEELSNAPEVDFSEYTNAAVEQTEDGRYIAELPYGQTIQMTPPYDPADTEAEVWELWGNFNLNLRPTDQVTVYKGSHLDPDGFTVVIERRNGKKITLHVPEGFKGNFNMNPEQINWVEGGGPFNVLDLPEGPGGMVVDGGINPNPSDPTPPVEEDESFEIPEAFADNFTVNGKGGEEGSTEVNPDGTPPDEVDGDTATYNKTGEHGDIDVRANHDDDVQEHVIYAPGQVVIRGADYSDLMKVGYDPETQTWTVYVYPGGDPTSNPERFIIKGGPDTKVILDVLGENSLVSTVDEAKDSVQIGLNGGSSESSVTWPAYGQFVGNVPMDGKGNEESLILANRIEKAGVSGDPADWQKVKDYLNNQLKAEYKNDWVREMITGLYITAGYDNEKLNEYLKLIPEDVRRLMMDKAMGKSGEQDEKGALDQWNSAQTAAIIGASLED